MESWHQHVSIKLTVKYFLAKDKYVKLWRIREDMSLKNVLEYKIHVYGVNQIKWSSDGMMLASAGNDCTLNVMDASRCKLIRNFRADSNVTCLDFNYSNNLILCGTFDNHIILWDMRSKTQIYQLLAHSEPLTSVSFSDDSTVLISSSYDGFCRIWDTFKGYCLKTIVLEKSPPMYKYLIILEIM